MQKYRKYIRSSPMTNNEKPKKGDIARTKDGEAYRCLAYAEGYVMAVRFRCRVPVVFNLSLWKEMSNEK
jgi:hypothetical protein